MKRIIFIALILSVLTAALIVPAFSVYADTAESYLYLPNNITVMLSPSLQEVDIEAATLWQIESEGLNNYIVKYSDTELAVIPKSSVPQAVSYSVLSKQSFKTLYTSKALNNEDILELTVATTLPVIKKETGCITVVYNNTEYYARNESAEGDGDSVGVITGPTANTTNNTDTDLLRIILIIGIAVPAVIIAIIIFKPGRAYYDDRTAYDDDDQPIYRR